MLKKQINYGLGHKNAARLEKFRIEYVNKILICNNANKKAIESYEQKLSRNAKEGQQEC